MKIRIRQWLSDWCETRMFKAQESQNIKREILWGKLQVKLLGLYGE